jgi:hypothetical protein
MCHHVTCLVEGGWRRAERLWPKGLCLSHVATWPAHSGASGQVEHQSSCVCVCHASLCHLLGESLHIGVPDWVACHWLHDLHDSLSDTWYPCFGQDLYFRCSTLIGKQSFSCWAGTSCMGLLDKQMTPCGPYRTGVLKWCKENPFYHYTHTCLCISHYICCVLNISTTH